MNRRTQALQAGVLLVASVPIALAGGILPADIEQADTVLETYLAIDQHPMAFRFHTVVGVVAVVVGLVGLLRLAPVVRTERTSRLVGAATTLAWIGTVIWLLVSVASVTLTVSRAHHVAAGTASPPGEFGQIETLELGYAAGLLAYPLMALAAGITGVIGRKASAALTVLGCVGSVLFVGTFSSGFVVMFCALPMGVLLIVRARRDRTWSSSVAQTA